MVILPHIEAVVEVRIVAGISDPQGDVPHRGQIIAVVALLAVHVHPGLIAALFDQGAESPGLGGQQEFVVVQCAGVLLLYRLPVVVHRQVQVAAIQQLQGVQGLLGGLLHGGGLGEEIHAHFDAGGPGPAVIAVEGPVRVQGALLAVAPQTQAQIGKVDALPLQRRPVDGALVVRHVHAPAGGVFRAQIADADAVAAVVVGVPAEVLLRQAAGGDTLMGRHPHHVKSVVDIYLPRVGIGLRLLPGAAAPQGQNDRRQQSANHQHRRDQQQHRQQTPPRPAAGRGNSVHSYLSFSKTCMSKAMRQSSCVSLHNFSTPAFGVFQQ